MEKGSHKPQEKVGKLSRQQLEEIATEKMEDLNANDIGQAKKIIAGTARSMGIDSDLSPQAALQCSHAGEAEKSTCHGP